MAMDRVEIEHRSNAMGILDKWFLYKNADIDC